jgi:hypothetical protein
LCKNGWGFVSGHFFMRIGITPQVMEKIETMEGNKPAGPERFGQ